MLRFRKRNKNYRIKNQQNHRIRGIGWAQTNGSWNEFAVATEEVWGIDAANSVWEGTARQMGIAHKE